MLDTLLGYVEFDVTRDPGDPPLEEMVRLKDPDSGSDINVTFQTEQLYFIAQGRVDSGTGIHYRAFNIDYENIASGSPIIEEWWPQSDHAYQPGGSGTAKSRENITVSGTTDIRVLMGFRYESDVELPVVETTSAVSTGQDTAKLTGNLTNDGDDSSTAVYFEYGEASDLGDADLVPADETNAEGELTLEIRGLSSETTYYYRAAAINEAGRAEGSIKSFVHASTTTVETKGVASEDITDTTAVIRGEVTDAGGEFAVTEREFVDGQDEKIGEDGEEGTGEFSFTWENLDPNTECSFSAYAINEAGTSQGEEKDFRTLAAVPGLDGANVEEDGSVKLTLDRNGNPGGTEFKVQRATDDDFESDIVTALDWNNPDTGTTLTVPKDQLVPGETNYFRVKARNADEEVTSYGDNTTSSLAQSDPPPAPDVEVNSDTEIEISWSAMTGADNYDVYENGIKVVSATEDTGVTRTGLNPNTSYEYEIVSKNDSGDSPELNSTTKYTHATVPQTWLLLIHSKMALW